jgi:hypothetical protein
LASEPAWQGSLSSSSSSEKIVLAIEKREFPFFSVLEATKANNSEIRIIYRDII